MKPMNIVRKFGAKIAAASLATGAFVAAHAQTTTSIDTLLDSIDLSGTTTKVVAVGVLVLGIALAFKGVDLGKRATRKV
jgi:type IV secretory pathway VirB2 component (pilin)